MNREDWDKWVDVCEKYNAFQKAFDDRGQEIIKVIKKVFGPKSVEWWSWKYYDSEIDPPEFKQTELQPWLEWYINGSDLIIIDKDNDEISLCDGIPSRWLFEDFEQEIRDGRIKYKTLEAERAEKESKEKDNVKALRKEALSKLSTKERKALGV